MRLEKYRFGLTTFIYFFVVVFGCMFVEGVDFFKDGYTPFVLKDTIFAGLTMLIGIVFLFFIERKRNKAKIDWLIFPIILIFTLVNLIGLYFPYVQYWINGANPNEYYVFSNDSLIFNTLSIIFGNALLYISLAIIPKRIAKVKSLSFIYWFIVAVGLFGILYSLAVEFDSYKLIFSAENDVFRYNSIKSFFYNENNYGQLLYLSIVACLLINACKPHWWHFLFVGVLFVGMIFSTSLTAIISTLGTLACYLLYEFIFTFKTHTKRNLAYLTGVIFGVTAIIIIFVVLADENVSFFAELQKFINNNILNKDFETATGRLNIWKRCVSALDTPMKLLFGLGYGQTLPYITDFYKINFGSNVKDIDSGLIEILCSNGIVGLILYISLIACFMVLCFVLTFKKKQKLGVPLFIFLFFALIYSMFESLIFFRLNTIGMVTTGIMLIPILIQYNKIRSKPVLEMNLMTIKINPHKLNSGQIITLYSFPLFLIISFFATALLIPSFIPANICWSVIIVCTLLFFTFPYLVAMIRRKSIGKWFLIKFIILSILLLVIPSISFGTMYLLGKGLKISLIVAGFIYFIMYFALTIFYFVTISSVKEFFTLIFKNLILTYLFPVLTYAIVIVPLTLLVVSLQATFTAYIFYLGSATLIFFILMLYVPSPFKSNKTFIRLIDEVNARLLLAQKMVFVLDK